ncbi:DUF1707 domain-containing protein [Micromonospora sp. NPDC000089]|uniref:DUF1707 SHOCT-like domain-containing protein n=1 Tax=unclassified Micromonospora TaxID=2617518 RepID=UPI0036B5FCE9
MDEREGMRAADVDRHEVAERLRLAVEEGRLDLHEYDDRLRRAYEAKTYGELRSVVTDLPGPAPQDRSALAPRPPVEHGTPIATESAAQPHGALAHPSGGLGEIWAPWLRTAAIVIAIWAISSLGSKELLYFWPAWVLGPWGALLLMRSANGGHWRHRRPGGH